MGQLIGAIAGMAFGAVAVALIMYFSNHVAWWLGGALAVVIGLLAFDFALGSPV